MESNGSSEWLSEPHTSILRDFLHIRLTLYHPEKIIACTASLWEIQSNCLLKSNTCRFYQGVHRRVHHWIGQGKLKIHQTSIHICCLFLQIEIQMILHW